jgi:cytochrome c peroxidase
MLSLGSLAAIAQTGPAPVSLASMKAEYVRPNGEPPSPADNRLSAARVELGRMLFFDPRLSNTGSMSCATCHNPSFGWEDGLPRGVGSGDRQLGRATPTVLNLAWGGPFFWDGRAMTLEQQAVGPIAAEGEMNLPHDQAVARVRSIAGYRTAFDTAYKGEGVTIDTIGKALASYERIVVSAEAPFDAWIKGKMDAISVSAARGFGLFNGKARCNICHSSWRFTDDGFHDIGVGEGDMGRAGIKKTAIVQLQNAFKTPTLRNIDQRAPFMHDGSLPSLSAVVDFYDRADKRRASISPEIVPLGLTDEEKRDLVAFMLTLTSKDTPQPVPVLPQ